MISQVILNTSELATWAITGVISITCILLYNILRSLQATQKEHSEELKEHGITLASHEEKINALKQ
ncbi:hypothetical protein WSM22_02910 [Cytophagales bacterium WSM2-2]|nr:hypothetical protein WSM22_02910 [Cytophagales bacterium WSM2-2]